MAAVSTCTEPENQRGRGPGSPGYAFESEHGGFGGHVEQERHLSGWTCVKFGAMAHPISPVKKKEWLGWRLLGTLFLAIGDSLACI